METLKVIGLFIALIAVKFSPILVPLLFGYFFGWKIGLIALASLIFLSWAAGERKANFISLRLR